MKPTARPALLCFTVVLGAAVPTAAVLAQDAAPAPKEAIAPPPPVGESHPIMPLSEVRIGMKGYGLTVFHGTKIEPFPVEVVSVISDFNPGRGTIWIRSDHPVLNVSGPVQGMSGSPIFLWEEGEEGTIGEGGRLIGAFAYGYSMVKECLAGVQPIELMRGVGEDVKRTGEAARRGGGSPALALALAQRLQTIASSRHVQPIDRYRLDAITKLMQQGLGQVETTAGDALPPPPQGLAGSGVQRLMLPMSVGSPQVAELAAPLLEPFGLVPVAGAAIAGTPPAGIDPEATRFEPGSVLSIPLVSGDSDLSAAGTVTEVLPDGTVLGFGHAMFGQGELALPMATGYVHFFVPRITTSFKQSGSLRIGGSLVQDQNAAVAGIGETRYRLAPARVAIEMPGYQEEFRYQIANHPQLTPVLSAVVAMQSLTASREFPIEHTLHLSGNVELSGGRSLAIDSMSAGSGAEAALRELLPALMLLMNNPHENLEVESFDLAARVEPELKVATLVNARLEKAEVAPGAMARVTVTIQPYGQPPRLLQGELKVPEGLAEGDYSLVLMDAAMYSAQVLMSRPHLQSSTSVDDLLDTIRRVMAVRSNAIYLVLQLPDQAIAVGRSEMPRLPSSRKAIIATPTSTLATAYQETAVARIPSDVVVQGQLAFQLSVRQPAGARLQPASGRP